MTSYTSSPQGGTTSLPQYLQSRQKDKPGATNAQTKPTVGAAAPQPGGAQSQPGANQLGAVAGAVGQAQSMQPPVAAPVAGGVAVPPPPPPPATIAAPPQMANAGAAPKPGSPWATVGAYQPPPKPAASPTATPAPTPAPSPAQPAPPAAGQPPAEPQGIGLLGIIQQMLNGGGRYSGEQVQGMRDSFTNQLTDRRRQEEDRLKAEHAARGTFYGSGLNTSLGDASERFQRGMADAETGLMRQVADANQQDKLSAIQAAFGFGQGQLQSQELQARILEMIAQQGMAGGPTIPGAVDAYGQLPMPGGGFDPAVFETLGSIYR